MKKWICLLGGLCLLHLGAAATEVVKAVSPDGDLVMNVTLKEGSPFYTLTYKGTPVVLESALGLNGNAEWNRDMVLASVDSASYDRSWKPLYGERSEIPDRYTVYLATFGGLKDRDRQAVKLQLEIRAYDEGVAFRYRFLEGGGYLHIDREYTEYTLPEGTWAYHTPRAQTEYTKRPLKDWPTETDRPLVLELPSGLYLCLTEAQVVDYVRTKFDLSTAKPHTVISAMYGAVDEIAPFDTPWRVMMVAEEPGQLLEHNYLLLNLNPPCALEQTWWIRPGKVMREVTLSTQGGKDLVDFAVKHHLQYVHFDAGWYGNEYSKASDATTVTVDPLRNPNNDLDLEEVVRYAHERGIGVWLYVNQRALAAQLDTLLPLYHRWGIKGIKFGFVQVGSHLWTKWMHDAVKKCAQYQLMVDIHDEYRPTGFSRTYPNLLTQEGIRGNEEMPDARNNLILPFTRFVAGAADYTIAYYSRDFQKYDPQRLDQIELGKRELKTTSAHQLAMAVVYYSPLQFLYWYDRPSDCGDEPELAFFDRVPTMWDDTRVLNGQIGEYITVVRRSGNDWFLGAMTCLEGRELTVALDFLPEGKRYRAHIYRDGSVSMATRTKVQVEPREVDAQTTLSVKMYPSGGEAIWFEAIE